MKTRQRDSKHHITQHGMKKLIENLKTAHMYRSEEITFTEQKMRDRAKVFNLEKPEHTIDMVAKGDK